LPVLVLIGVSGCAGTFNSYDNASYILELKKDRLCVEGTSQCAYLRMIVPSYREPLIAKSYGLKPGPYEWNSDSLAKLMLNPPNDLYEVELIAPGVYRLPPVLPVHTTWDYLALEYYELYDRGGEDSDGATAPMPHSRRFI